MTNEELLEIAYTRELTDERVATAAAYWLDASRHERIEADGVILARYARKAMQEIEQLKADKAALLECIANTKIELETWQDDKYARIVSIQHLSECLKQIGGTADES